MKRSALFPIILVAGLLFLTSNANAYTNVTDCTTLNSTSETYLLNTSIVSSGTCLTINANNIVIDCAGWNITYGYGAANKFGVGNTGFNNITVKNCLFTKNSTSFAFTNSINFSNANDSYIYNNTIRTNGSTDSYGIILSGGSCRNRIENNTIIATGTGDNNFGIFLFSRNSNNTIIGNNITTNGVNLNDGVKIEDNSNNNTVTQNNITISRATGNFNTGIELKTSTSNNTITGNQIITNGTDNNYGLLVTGNNNTVNNNNITARGTTVFNIGISIFGTPGNNNTATNNNITTFGSTDNWGIDIETAIGTTVTNNMVRGNGNQTNYGIYIYSSNYTTVNNANITGTYQGIQVYLSNNTVITGASIVNSSSMAINATQSNWLYVYNSNFSSSGRVYLSSTNNSVIAHSTMFNSTTGNTANIEVRGTQNVTANNNTIRNSWSNGIFVTRSSLVNVTSNYINDTGYDRLGGAIQLEHSASNVTVQNNIAEYGTYGIEFLDLGSGTLTNLTISNNTVLPFKWPNNNYGNSYSPWGIGIFAYSVTLQDLEVANNNITLSNFTDCFSIGNEVASGPAMSRVKIHDNNLNNCASGLWTDTQQDFTFSNNTITNATIAINIQNSNRTTLENNTIRNATNIAIFLKTIKNASISNTKIIDSLAVMNTTNVLNSNLTNFTNYVSGNGSVQFASINLNNASNNFLNSTNLFQGAWIAALDASMNELFNTATNITFYSLSFTAGNVYTLSTFTTSRALVLSTGTIYTPSYSNLNPPEYTFMVTNFSSWALGQAAQPQPGGGPPGTQYTPTPYPTPTPTVMPEEVQVVIVQKQPAPTPQPSPTTTPQPPSVIAGPHLSMLVLAPNTFTTCDSFAIPVLLENTGDEYLTGITVTMNSQTLPVQPIPPGQRVTVTFFIKPIDPYTTLRILTHVDGPFEGSPLVSTRTISPAPGTSFVCIDAPEKLKPGDEVTFTITILDPAASGEFEIYKQNALVYANVFGGGETYRATLKLLKPGCYNAKFFERKGLQRTLIKEQEICVPGETQLAAGELTITLFIITIIIALGYALILALFPGKKKRKRKNEKDTA
ncbi:MAG TPA: right-handed parallel beta-helix repeat-containing protein [Candidatus Norongarragalinales archaeon]|jgi:parallel beta-helix repeat protein|nr:right-handed parallel beta-helix repeat-containing protein [Candidatus Norongarragalinales archaeon]